MGVSRVTQTRNEASPGKPAAAAAGDEGFNKLLDGALLTAAAGVAGQAGAADADAVGKLAAGTSAAQKPASGKKDGETDQGDAAALALALLVAPPSVSSALPNAAGEQPAPVVAGAPAVPAALPLAAADRAKLATEKPAAGAPAVTGEPGTKNMAAELLPLSDGKAQGQVQTQATPATQPSLVSPAAPAPGLPRTSTASAPPLPTAAAAPAQRLTAAAQQSAMAPAGLALVGAAAPRAAGATPQRQGSSAPAAAGTQVTVAVERGPAQPAQQTSGAPATKPVTPASDSEKAILPTANARAPSTGRDTAPSAPDQPLQTAGTPPQPVLSNARPQAPQPAPVPMQPPPLVEQVAAGIRQAADGQVDHIRIELKPASLGAIEVRLDLKHDGSVAATVTADRPDTLAMLHHDAHGLEQALKDAGLRTDPGSLSFNLRGGGSQPGQQQFQQQQPMPRPSQTYAGPQGRFPDEPPRNPSQPAAIVSRRRHPGALDIRI